MLEFIEAIIEIGIITKLLATLIAIFLALVPLFIFIRLGKIKRATYDIADMLEILLEEKQSEKKLPNSRNNEVDEDQPINMH